MPKKYCLPYIKKMPDYSSIKIDLDGHSVHINSAKTTKYLGITIDCHLGEQSK